MIYFSIAGYGYAGCGYGYPLPHGPKNDFWRYYPSSNTWDLQSDVQEEIEKMGLVSVMEQMVLRV